MLKDHVNDETVKETRDLIANDRIFELCPVSKIKKKRNVIITFYLNYNEFHNRNWVYIEICVIFFAKNSVIRSY